MLICFQLQKDSLCFLYVSQDTRFINVRALRGGEGVQDEVSLHSIGGPKCNIKIINNYVHTKINLAKSV